jgi:hypothetical protein
MFVPLKGPDQQHNKKNLHYNPTRLEIENTTSTQHKLSLCQIWLPIENPMFMSHASHMRDRSYTRGKGPMFTYVETTICSCKGVRRECLL